MLPTTKVVGFPPGGFSPRLDHSKARGTTPIHRDRTALFDLGYSEPGFVSGSGTGPWRGTLEHRGGISADFNSRWTPLTSRPQNVARSGVASFVPEFRLPPSRWQAGRSVRGRITAARTNRHVWPVRTGRIEALSDDNGCETAASSRTTQAETHVGFLPRLQSWASTLKSV